MVSIEVTKVLKDLYGNVFASARSNKETGIVELTNGEVYINALLAPVSQSESYEDSLFKVEIAERIKRAQEALFPVELDEKEIQLLEALVPKANNLPLIVAQAVGLLKKEN